MCSKFPPPACIYDLRQSRHWSIAASMTFCSKSTQVCVKHFAGHRCYKSLFPTRIVAQHHKFYNLQVHFDEAYTIRLMQFYLVISHCNITFLLLRLSQGSVATLIRRVIIWKCIIAADSAILLDRSNQIHGRTQSYRRAPYAAVVINDNKVT